MYYKVLLVQTEISDNTNYFGQPSPFMTTLYQFKHGIATHKDIEEALLCSRIFLSGPVVNIKLSLKLCHFEATLGGYNNLIGGMGWQYFLHNKL